MPEAVERDITINLDAFGLYKDALKQIGQLRDSIEKIFGRINALEKPGTNTVAERVLQILLAVQRIEERQETDMAGQVEALQEIAAAIRETTVNQANQITPEMGAALDRLLAQEKAQKAAIDTVMNKK